MKIFKKIGGACSFTWKNCRAFMVTTAILLVFCLALNIVATQVPLVHNTFNSLFGEERRVVTKGDPADAMHFTPDEGIVDKATALAAANRVNEELCAEGFVLLKNDGALPLPGGARVSVFGMNSADPVYGGSGSGAKENSNGVDIDRKSVV